MQTFGVLSAVFVWPWSALLLSMIGLGTGAVMVIWFLVLGPRWIASTAFGAPLSDAFKQKYGVEPGIWKDDISYLVETAGRTSYFPTLTAARDARDRGILGHVAPVQIAAP